MLSNMARMTEQELEEFMSDGPVTGWGVYENEAGTEVNVIPENDIRHHIYGSMCKCRPTKDATDEGVPMFVHQSYDGREAYEMGKKTH